MPRTRARSAPAPPRRSGAPRARWRSRRSPCSAGARHRWRPRGRSARAAWAGASGSPIAQPRNVDDGERVDAERVVVEIVGELECRAGVLERSHEALLEARRPRQAALDHGLQGRPRRRLAQGLLEQCDGPVEPLELGEEDERLGAQRPEVRLGQRGRSRSSWRASILRLRDAPEPLPALDAGVRRRRSAASAAAPARRARPQRRLRRAGPRASRRRRARRRPRHPGASLDSAR